MRILIKCVACSFLLFISSPLLGQATAPPQSEPAPSVQEILDRMVTRNAWQDRTLLEFRALRKFYAANFRFKTESTMYVQTVFRRPDQLQSTVTSHEGSNLIRSRVFDRILEAENETRAKKDKQQVDIIPANYTFSFVDAEDCSGRSCYRMRISRRRREEYAVDGEIWIDTGGYIIVRIHGVPAERPALWILEAGIDGCYMKGDGIWLASEP